MAEIIETGFPGRVFELAIYRNEDLDTRRGTVPEVSVAEHVADSLSDLSINHRIIYGFDPVPVNNNNNSCPSSDGPTVAYEVWRDYVRNGNAPFEAKDSNLLINDAPGGGCAGIGGNIAVGPGRDIDHVDGPIEGTSPWHFDIYSCMHEVGHNMGYSHANNAGRKTLIDGVEYKTPTNGRDDAHTNLCGQSNPADPTPGSDDVARLFYNDCVADTITIREDQGRVFVSSLLVQPNPVEAGALFTITATVTNTMLTDQEVTEPVLVGDEQIGELVFNVPAGGTDTTTIVHSVENPGEYIVQVNQQTELLIVEEAEPADIVVQNVSVDQLPAQVGVPNQIIVTAENVGGSVGNRTLDVFVGGAFVGGVSFGLDPGEIGTDRVNWTPRDPGTFNLDAGRIRTTVTVEPAGGGGGDGGGGQAGLLTPRNLVVAGGATLLFIGLSRRGE